MKEPFIIRNFIGPEILKHFKSRIELVKKHNIFALDQSNLSRDIYTNDPELRKIHKEMMTPIAIKKFQEPLEDTFHFVASYRQGEGLLAMHSDVPECYQTIDICVDQNEPWPFYINHRDLVPDGGKIDFHLLPEDSMANYRKNSTEYILNPGDAIFYSGTRFPHWRDKIQPNNFCDMILFFFKK